jgi:hypothetical protein
MGRWMFLVALVTVLSGCSSGQEGSNAEVATVADARVKHERAASMAYEHAIELEVPAGHTRQVAEAVKQACAALPARGCTLIEAGIRHGDRAGATIRMRITPEGVNTVLRALDGRGKVLEQTTEGKDLAEPIADGQRKMTMLVAYRDQLHTLARQRTLDADALIKLHRELAEVQSEIDNAAGSQAQLQRRVDTELLTVSMHEPVNRQEANRVRQAVDDFGDDLLRGVAGLITFVASTIPFALAGTVGYLAWRRISARRRKTAPTPREG